MTNLNKTELEALRILWDAGELKPAGIAEQFSWVIDNGTLRSVLRVLIEKGYVTRRKEGKAFLYRAKATRRGLQGQMARLMAHVFAGGSTGDLIAQLIRTERLSSEELAELRRVANEKGGKGKERRKR